MFSYFVCRLDYEHSVASRKEIENIGDIVQEAGVFLLVDKRIGSRTCSNCVRSGECISGHWCVFPLTTMTRYLDEKPPLIAMNN